GTTITLSSGVGVTAGTATAARFSIINDPQKTGSIGGNAVHQLILAQMAGHSHGASGLSWSGSVSGSISPNPHDHDYTKPSGTLNKASGGTSVVQQTSGATTSTTSLSWSGTVSGSITGSVASAGGDQAHPNMQPSG